MGKIVILIYHDTSKQPKTAKNRVLNANGGVLISHKIDLLTSEIRDNDFYEICDLNTRNTTRTYY